MQREKKCAHLSFELKNNQLNFYIKKVLRTLPNVATLLNFEMLFCVVGVAIHHTRSLSVLIFFDVFWGLAWQQRHLLVMLSSFNTTTFAEWNDKLCFHQLFSCCHISITVWMFNYFSHNVLKILSFFFSINGMMNSPLLRTKGLLTFIFNYFR